MEHFFLDLNSFGLAVPGLQLKQTMGSLLDSSAFPINEGLFPGDSSGGCWAIPLLVYNSFSDPRNPEFTPVPLDGSQEGAIPCPKKSTEICLSLVTLRMQAHPSAALPPRRAPLHAVTGGTWAFPERVGLQSSGLPNCSLWQAPLGSPLTGFEMKGVAPPHSSPKRLPHPSCPCILWLLIFSLSLDPLVQGVYVFLCNLP